MGTTAPRRAGRPRTAILDRARITQHAMGVVLESGYESLTMQRLARSLGVSPSALYNHVSSKNDLLQWIQETVMDEVDRDCFDTMELGAALETWAVSYRSVFARHVPLIPVIAVLPVADSPNTLTMYERVARALHEHGVPQEQIVPIIVALESFIFGSAIDTSAPADIFDPGEHQASAQFFSRSLDAQQATGRRNSDDAFMIGLRAMITGLLEGR
ncbi:TetR/AcrR family transcriptional regulator [Glutamicibacter creatinolyticus]|uniref:TetR/AcrR family transcriptional regulator n=1 Tax=Glutamicibacter creatinolyticus TaxID=162496 RepID=UPI0031D8805C